MLKSVCLVRFRTPHELFSVALHRALTRNKAHTEVVHFSKPELEEQFISFKSNMPLNQGS